MREQGIGALSRWKGEEMNLKLSRDINGNKIVKVKIEGSRGFSIQTLYNLPLTHKEGIGSHTRNEIHTYIRKHGTERQKDLLGIY